MRAIKFRAWNRQKKGFSYFCVGDWEKIKNIQRYENEVGQFTGLSDKNGKEIYEGDVLEFSWVFNKRDRHIVVWDDSLTGFEPFVFADRGDYVPNDCKVIGNIYENLELIK